MESDHNERWIVGFLYRLSTIAGVLLLVLYMLWWLMSVTVGVMTAASAEWSLAIWIVAIVAVSCAVNVFDELVERTLLGWRDSDWVERLAGMIAVAGIAYWMAWFVDWERVVRGLQGELLSW